MAYNGVKQVVIKTSTNKVKRWGHCDFAIDDTFDPVTESVIEKDFEFDHGFVYTWNEGTSTFDKNNKQDEDNYTLQDLLDMGVRITPGMVKNKIKLEAVDNDQRKRIRQAIRDGFNQNILEYEWNDVRDCVEDYLEEGLITQDDYDLIDTILPED
jgi:hypothetical protein